MTAIASIPWSNDLRTLATRFAGRVAINTGERTLTYAALSAYAHALARTLAARGVGPGAAAATFLANGTEVVWAAAGITLTGACEVMLNPAFTHDELAWCAKLASLRVIVTDAAGAPRVERLGLEVVRVEDIVASGDPLSNPLSDASSDPWSDGGRIPNAPADAWGRITYSSGTTGKPKGLVYSHARRWLAHLMLKAALPFSPAPGSRVLLMTPYTHGASLLAPVWLDHGGEAVLLPGVDLPRVERFLASGTIDAVFAPPTVIAKLAEAFPDRRFPGVRTVFTGTSTLTPGLYAKARALFGPCIRVTYGKGENFNPITVLEPADTDAVYTHEAGAQGACLGWPANGVELAIHDDSGTRLADGETGEIRLRSRHMYLGHVDADGFHPVGDDGWHHTGDLGRIDARGRLWLMGRLADVVKTGGYKVYPEEIEAVLSGVPGCTQICVATLPSDYWGEIIIAAAEGVTDANWIGHAQARLPALARYKHPRAWVVVDPLPRNAQGKLSRRTVRDRVLERYRLLDGPHPALEPHDAA